MANTAVVILNYNGEKYLRQFLSSVESNSPSADIIVADNGSTDGSVSYLKANHPKVRLLTFDQNYGYTGGYNKVIEAIDYEFCILLNSDIEVTKGWIAPIITLMASKPNIAACQPKILSYHNKSHFEYAGASGGYLDSMGYPYCRGRVLDTVEEDLGQYDDIAEVFWATGACLFVRRDDFIEAGGFDVDFFAHMEEIDLCWRFHLMGKSSYCIPESVVYHVGGGTLNKSNPRKTYLNFRNNLSLIFKNENSLSLIWKLPFKFALDWLAGIKFWKENSFSHFSAVLRAQRDFIKLLPMNFRKRKMVNQLKCKQESGSNSISPSLFLPFVYFIKQKKTFSELVKK